MIIFLAPFQGSIEDINLNVVMAIQKAELKWTAIYFVTIFSITAYDGIQFPNPKSIPM